MKKLVTTEIALPEAKAVKITDENFLALLTENKGLREKNSQLNKLVGNLTHQLNNCRTGVKRV